MTGPPPLALPPECDEVNVDASDCTTYFGSSSGFRLHRVGGRVPRGFHPLTYVGVGSAPAWRWDPPTVLSRGGARYGVWYGSTSQVGAMLEVFYFDEPWVPLAARSGRLVGQVEVVRPLRLIDLHAPAVGRIYPAHRLDESICTTHEYSITQAWSELFHECNPSIDGLLYRSRKAGSEGVNVALFDRALDAILPAEDGISIDEPSLADARARFIALTDMAWPLT